MDNSKSALIIRLSSLGDVALTSCVIDPLVKRGYKPYLLTYKPYHTLFEDDKRLEVIAVEKGKLSQVLERLKGFDLYVDLHKNLKTLYLRLKLGGRWVSYDKQAVKRRLSVYFERFRKPYSVVNAYLQAIGEKGGRPYIEVSQERLRRWKDVLGEGFITLGPGARYKKKKYLYFKELSELLIKEGFKVVLVGGEKDREETEDFPGINLCGELSLVDVLAVLKLSKVFVGNDSGLLHMARAVKTKCIQIYGGTHPTLGFSLFEDEGKVFFKNLECQPCHIHGAGECKFGDYRCLDFKPEEILSAIHQLSL